MIYSISDLSEMLARRAEEVARMLLPNGRAESNKWKAGSIEGENGSSLDVNLDGDHAGEWRDWNGGDHGDLIDLWSKSRNLPIGDTLRQVKEFLGIANPREYKATASYHPCPKNPKIKPLAPNGRALKYLTEERKISENVIELYKVEGDGSNLVFHYYDYSGKLINRSYISLKRDENGKKICHTEKKCPPILFGWHALPRPIDRTVIITEGQIDAMSWATWGQPALSIPSGTGNMDWIDVEWENLEMFSEIFLSFDMDEAGRAAAKKAAHRLGLHRCRIIELPHKDANECLQKGMKAEEAGKLMIEAPHIQHSGIRSATDYTRDTLKVLFPDPEDTKRRFTDPMLKGWDGQFEFFPGDVTIWSGVAGHGKTTLLSCLMGKALRYQKVFICSLEMLPGKLLSVIVRQLRRKGSPSKEEVQSTLNALAGRLIFADKVGSIKQDDLFEMMQFAWSRYGIDHFVIDSLMRVEGLEENYPEQGNFLNKLQSFSKGTDSHVHLVAHPRKTAEETRPGKLDIKGSSLLFNNCDNLVIIHKNMEKEELRRNGPMSKEMDAEMYDAELVSEKQREGGWTGMVKLRYDRTTHAFTQWSEDTIEREIANGGIVYQEQQPLLDYS